MYCDGNSSVIPDSGGESKAFVFLGWWKDSGLGGAGRGTGSMEVASAFPCSFTTCSNLPSSSWPLGHQAGVSDKQMT